LRMSFCETGGDLVSSLHGIIERPEACIPGQGSRGITAKGKAEAMRRKGSEELVVAMKAGPMKHGTRRAKSLRGATVRGENPVQRRGSSLERAEAKERDNAERIRMPEWLLAEEGKHAIWVGMCEVMREYRLRLKPAKREIE
jgi:hypothetical protein